MKMATRLNICVVVLTFKLPIYMYTRPGGSMRKIRTDGMTEAWTGGKEQRLMESTATVMIIYNGLWSKLIQWIGVILSCNKHT